MKDKYSLGIDLDNAVNFSNENNFTVLLFRIIFKSDGENMEKLRRVYPVEVKAVEIYRNCCQYLKDETTGMQKVDYMKIAELAIESVNQG